MAALTQLHNVHLEDCFRYNFTVLLRNANKLSHILHTSDWLEDLSTDCNQWLSTVRQLLSLFNEVRRSLCTSLLSTELARSFRQLH